MTELTPRPESGELHLMFEAHRVRVRFTGSGLCPDPQMWIVLADAATPLCVSSVHSGYIKHLCEDEKGREIFSTPGGNQTLIVVSLSGLSKICARSHQARVAGTMAYRFMRWVDHELPKLQRQKLVQQTQDLEAHWIETRPHWVELRRLILLGLPFRDVALQLGYSHGKVRYNVHRMCKVGFIPRADRLRIAFRRRKALPMPAQMSLALA